MSKERWTDWDKQIRQETIQPSLNNVVHVYTTADRPLGEIMGMFREMFGEYREPTIV